MKDNSMKVSLNFNNTENGFVYKSNKELFLAKLLFMVMKSQKLVELGSKAIIWAVKLNLPVNGLIRKTLFKQFVGGETLKEVSHTLEMLSANKVQAILDYGAEGKDDKMGFDLAANEFLMLIPFAAQIGKVPFISIKITALGRFELLEKVNQHINTNEKKLQVDLSILQFDEIKEWEELINRIDSICRKATAHHIGVLIDAEESWIQNPINLLSEMMMRKYNVERYVVFNTIQFYNRNSFQFLQTCIANATEGGYKLGLKIVRGAYMEKERERAESLNYPCPIQIDKRATDQDFNKGLTCCLEHIDKLSLIIASHNEESNLLATNLLTKLSINKNNPNVHFSQLFGMSDHITFNMAGMGYNVSKYIPYGPIKDVIPYLMRRAQENTSVSGQTNRELSLINVELKRRKKSLQNS